MPSASAPYQRTIVNGIPYWRDADGALYYYENSTLPSADTRICLGTQATGLHPDWQNRLSSRLASYRSSVASRSRAPTATAAPKT